MELVGDGGDLLPRVRAFLKQILDAQGGPIGPFVFGRGPWFDGDCASCGEPVGDGSFGRCQICSRAVRMAMEAYDQGENP